MTTQAQTHTEQIFAGIFGEANLSKFKDNTVETDIFLDELEKQFPDFIFILGPNLFIDGSNQNMIVNAFNRSIFKKVKKRKSIFEKWIVENSYEPLYGFDFEHKVIFSHAYFGGAKWSQKLK